ncbi:MAG: polyprenyl synthetase family protein [Chloroflexia bacterium]|nr:polyprenyl synthetase family protein [Chloroflexia bacterium]
MGLCLPADPPARLQPFYGMIEYHLGWRDAALRPVRENTGKRLRPLLSLLACEVSSGLWRPALPAAAAVELLHNFTLIHDDIEDNSPLRRGRPTVWNLWGIPQAINVGDGLFVLARTALLRLRSSGLANEAFLEALEVFDQAILRICEGQYLDLSFEGRLDVDETSYGAMISAKTGALLVAAVQLGALIGGATAASLETWRRFGLALGLAFQVQDDWLGVWGNPVLTGKPAAADLHGRKLGLPLVHALGQATGAAREFLVQRLRGREPLSEEDIAAILQMMEDAGSRDYVQQQAACYHRQSLEFLAQLPEGPARSLLERLVESLLGRSS